MKQTRIWQKESRHSANMWKRELNSPHPRPFLAIDFVCRKRRPCWHNQLTASACLQQLKSYIYTIEARFLESCVCLNLKASTSREECKSTVPRSPKEIRKEWEGLSRVLKSQFWTGTETRWVQTSWSITLQQLFKTSISTFQTNA